MKKNQLVMLLALLLLLTGCTAPKNTTTDGSESVENTMPTDREHLKNEMLDLDTYTLADETDYSQSDYLHNRISRSETGYYYAINQKLRFFDLESKTFVTVCNKPSCTHNDGECVANTASLEDGKILDFGNLIYDKGYVYCLGFDGYTKLWRTAGDGSTREPYMSLYKLDGFATGFTSPAFMVHQNTLFYIDNDEEQQCLRKCTLGTEEISVAFATNKPGDEVYRLKAYGDFVFFQAGRIELIDDEVVCDVGLYAYNLKTCETKLVLNDVVAGYDVVGTKVIYASETGICSYDLKTAENCCIIEYQVDRGMPSFVNNSRYIVLDNLEVYTLEGEHVCKLALDSFSNHILGMDEDYIIANDFIAGENYEADSYVYMLLLKPVSQLDDKPFEKYICED